MNTIQAIAIVSKCIADTNAYNSAGSICAYMEFFEQKTEYISIVEG